MCASSGPRSLPNPPHVPRHLVGDWEAFLTLLKLREWVEGIKVPFVLFVCAFVFIEKKHML